MKAAEIRELTLEELQQKHDEWLGEHFGLRIKHALGQLENPLVLRALRRDIARAKTLLREQGIKEVPRKRRQTTAAKSAAPKKKAAAQKARSKKDSPPKKRAVKKMAAKRSAKKSEAGSAG